MKLIKESPQMKSVCGEYLNIFEYIYECSNILYRILDIRIEALFEVMLGRLCSHVTKILQSENEIIFV